MRVLHIVQKPQRRGAEVFASQLSTELRRQGHTVGIAYLYPHHGPGSLPLGPDDVLLDGIETHPFERLAHPRLLARLRQAIASFRPDVVQVNGARSVKYGALARRLPGGGNWALLYRNIGNPGDWLRGRLKRQLYTRLVVPALDGVVGVSRTTLDAVVELYGLEVPTAAIPRAVDPAALVPSRPRDEVRHNASTPDTVPVVVAVGSLTPEKRLDRLIRSIAKLTPQIPNVHLWLVGDGPLRSTLEAQSEAQEIAERTHFFGVRDDIADLLGASDLLALTSDTEGIPGAVLEAGCAGLPVVATRVGGVAECALDGETAVLVERDDEASLTEALSRLLTDPAQRLEMGRRAARHIRQHFAIPEIARRYVEVYQRLHAPESPPAHEVS